MRFFLTGGNCHDITQARQLLSAQPSATVIAAKSYDANWFIELIEQQDANPLIPPRRSRHQPREYDRHL